MDPSFILLWLHLCATPRLGAAKLAELAQAFSANGEFSQQRLIHLLEKLPKTIQQRVLPFLSDPLTIQLPLVEDWMNWAEQPHNRLITLPDPLYPAMLRILPDPPPILFVKGLSELLWQPQLAIVGSRNPTASGRENAFHFAKALATNGFTITSGLALGIDGAAHKGALQQLGSTIAVLGSGLNIIYPARHRSLADQIAESGLIVSELSMDTPPNAANFPRRNRIISGLSLGTLVVEASVRSGSLITARLALEQGREVFAIPGSIQNSQARGCHQLIKLGAKLTETTDDIFSELPQLMKAYQQRQLSSANQLSTALAGERLTDKKVAHDLCEPPKHVLQSLFDRPQELPGKRQATEDNRLLATHSDVALEPVAQLVLDAVGFEVTHTDHIVERTGIEVSVVQAELVRLELTGLVRAEKSGGVVRLR